MSENIKYSNGIIQGTLSDIEELLDIISRIAINEGHTKLYVQNLKDNIYEQFHVPKAKRRVLRLHKGPGVRTGEVAVDVRTQLGGEEDEILRYHYEN